MYEREVFKLIKKDLPKITGNTILEDNDKGGELLIYRTHNELYKEIKIFGFAIRIVFLKTKPKDRIFLRPFKKNWDTSNHRLPAVYWGRKNNPLTNLWCELNKCPDSITEESNEIFVKNDLLNKTLSRCLKRHESKFFIDLINVNSNK